MLTINLEHAEPGFSSLVAKAITGEFVTITGHGKPVAALVSVDAPAAALAGQSAGKAIAACHDPGMANATIAGIAKSRNLVIVTRNTKHFLPFGVTLATPEQAAL